MQVQSAAPIQAFKGFDKDWKCRGYQYAIGQTYQHDGDPVRCTDAGFHACLMPFDVWNYYPLSTSVFATVEVGGKIDHAGEGEDSKIASASVTIKAEIRLPEMIRAAVAWIKDHAKSNIGIGISGHAAATGNSGHAAATGISGHAAATGYRGHAAATGDSGIAAALGINATAMAGPTGWIVLAAWTNTDDGWQIATVRTAKVGGPECVLPGVAYRLTADGVFVRDDGTSA